MTAPIKAGRSEDLLTQLTDSYRSYFSVKHVYFTSSGKCALTTILIALSQMRPGKYSVIIPAYNCFSVPSSIKFAGLRVVPCDINPDTLDFDYQRLESLISEDTLCIIPTHLFSIAADVKRLKRICGRKDVFLVEDAAQAMGVTTGGEKLGTIGDVGFFSLGRGKNLSCGGGGVIVTNSDTISDKLKNSISKLTAPGLVSDCRMLAVNALISIFIRPNFYWFPQSLPFLKLGKTIFYKSFPMEHLTKLHATICLSWSNRLDYLNNARMENAEQILANLGVFSKPMSSIPYLRIPALVENKKKLEETLSAPNYCRLGITRMYPFPVNEIPEISEEFRGQDYPGAKLVSETLITIPCHTYMNREDIERLDIALNRFDNLKILPIHPISIAGDRKVSSCVA